MTSNNFIYFLSQLGYPLELLNSGTTDTFSYSVATNKSSNASQRIVVDYFYCSTKDDLFNHHLDTWNRNEKSAFIAIFDNDTYLIDARYKPDKENPLPNRIILKSFDYGVSTIGYDITEHLALISKEGIDTAYYFNFVIEHQKRKKATEVDKDLLLNLLELRNDLVTKQNEEIIHLLILRCLFVKYLEDRGVFVQNYLYDVLKTQSAEKLISAFKKVRKINGDLFKNNELCADDLTSKCLKKLSLFFGYSDYRTKQGKFFPYQFDKIPIQLISSIYESFLRQETKKGNGVYYTPSFLVNFMLSQSLIDKLGQKTRSTVLDPACGSGAFLVESFRLLIKFNKAEGKYEKKKDILQNQLFGIDLDPRALQIAAFSLYLALLEGEDPAFIREKIRTESPILPSLIGKTLINGNALTDDILFATNNWIGKKAFDCIVANPPWGSVPEDESEENIETREAMGNKLQSGTMPIYSSVSDFQRSQAFLLRTREWSDKNTIISMVVNNSIFLNENAKSFRTTFLANYQLEHFYELTDINKILFKKRRIGEIKDKPVEIGANEPCCVLVYKVKAINDESDNLIQYVSPKLNVFTENLHIIASGSKDVIEIKQSDLAEEDILWRIFVNGKWEDYQLIKKRIIEKDNRVTIECRSGFQPQKFMEELGPPRYETLIEPSDFDRYYLPPLIERRFNWNQRLRRKGNESKFEGKRILIPVRPLASDELRFRAVRTEQRSVYKDNILAIKILKDGEYVSDYSPYLAILNSKFLGYLYYQISSQWGKGDAKRSTLRNSDVEALPFPKFEESDERVQKLSQLVSSIETLGSAGEAFEKIETEIDDLVYELYNLTDYEKAVINEFYEAIHSRKNDKVNLSDIKRYAETFCSVFRLMLSDDVKIASNQYISNTIGAVVCFSIDKNGSNGRRTELTDVMHIVKKAQMEWSYFSYALTEEKVKYYDKPNLQLFIVKSNQYKDWTIKQAIDDANEEISNLITQTENDN